MTAKSKSKSASHLVSIFYFKRRQLASSTAISKVLYVTIILLIIAITFLAGIVNILDVRENGLLRAMKGW